MKLENRFELEVAPEELFDVLLDVERVARCMPGAALEGREGDAFSGRLKTKVGPITAQYQGTLEFLEVDRDDLRVVMKGTGRETRGQGGAEATVVARVVGANGGSAVELVTDLRIRGKVAQFGRGVLSDVSGAMLQTFADNLREELVSSGTAPASGAPTAAETSAGGTTRAAGGITTEPAGGTMQEAGGTTQELDVLKLMAGPLLRRALPALAAAAVLVLLARGLRRRR